MLPNDVYIVAIRKIVDRRQNELIDKREKKKKAKQAKKKELC